MKLLTFLKPGLICQAVLLALAVSGQNLVASPDSLAGVIGGCNDSLTFSVFFHNPASSPIQLTCPGDQYPPGTFFYDDFEDGLDNWIVEGTWALSDSSYEGASAVSESPESPYQNGLNCSLTMKDSLFVLDDDSASLGYFTRYDLETSWDFLYIELSVNSGAWLTVGSLTGTQLTWMLKTINLGNFLGHGDYFRIRFRFYSDMMVNQNGVFLDNITLRGCGSFSPWLAMLPDTLIVPPLDSSQVNFIFKAGGLTSGTYQGWIRLQTNDTLQPEIDLHYSMIVTGDAMLTAGDSIVDFDSVPVYSSATRFLLIENQACSTLSVDTVYSGSSGFSLQNTSFTIPPFQSLLFPVTFHPVTEGSFETSLLVVSNASNLSAPDTICILRGFALPGPLMSISADSLVMNLACGDSAVTYLTIHNTGTDSLDFTITPPLNKNLRIHYPLNGNATDMSGNGYNGTVYQAVSTTDRFNQAASALQFDGNNDYVRAPNGVWFNGDFTVSSWVYITAIKNWCRMFDFGSGANNNNVLGILSAGTSGNFAGEIFSGSAAGGRIISPQPVALNQWVNLTMSLKGNNLRLYKNGMLWAGGITTTIPANVNRTGCYLARSNWSGDAYYKGKLDEFYLYNRSLSDDEILSLYLDGKASWLSATPLSGAVGPGDSVVISVKMNARYYSEGNYRLNLSLISNDPVSPLYDLSCLMVVSGESATTLSDTLLDFGSVMQHATGRDTLTITNSGCGVLSIEASVFSSPEFHFPAGPVITSVQQFSSIRVPVEFSPAVPGNFSTTLTLGCNDTSFLIHLSGNATGAPLFGLSDDSLSVSTSDCFDTTTAGVFLKNNGLSDLNWAAMSLDEPGNSLKFTGQNQQVAIGNCGNVPEQGTIEFWMKADNLASYHFPFTTCGLDLCMSGFNFLTIDNALHVYVGDDYGINSFYDFGNIQLNTWKHVALTWNKSGDYVKLYLDGNFISQQPNDHWPGVFTNVLLGTAYQTGYYWAGEMDEVRIWKTERTAAEIQASRFHKLSGNEPGLIAYWNLDEGSGNMVYDLSKYRHHGSFSGATRAASTLDFIRFTSFNPQNGTVIPGDSAELEIKVVTSGLINGDYINYISVGTNDPLHPSLEISCGLEIQGAFHPLLAMTDTLHHFGSLPIYASKTDSLQINNTGCTELIIDTLCTTDSAFYPGITQVSIPPFSSKKIAFTFHPLTEGNYNANLVVSSNALNLDDVDTICILTATALPGPLMNISADSIFGNASCGDSVMTTYTIRNLGTGPLYLNLTHSFLEGQLLHYPLNGNAQDNSGYGQNGTVYGAVASADRYGIPGASLYFDGSNDYIDVPDAVWFSGNFTVTSWVNEEVVRSWCRLFDFGGGQTSNNVLGILSNSTNGRFVGEIYEGSSSGGQVTSPQAIPLNQWVHLAITLQGNVITLYKNGQYWTSGTSTKLPVNIVRTSCYLARSNWGSDQYYQGKLDEFRLFNRALSATELQEIYYLTGEGTWLQTIIGTDTVEAGDSLVIPVKMLAGSLTVGTYQSPIKIYSNDPISPQFQIPCILHIAGEPQIDVSDTVLEFDSIMQHTVANDTITIFNHGCDTLWITDAFVTSTGFDIAPGQVVSHVLPYSSRKMVLQFAPDTTGPYSSDLYISIEDSTVSIHLAGTGTGAPVYVGSQDSVTLATAYCRDSLISNIRIKNNGLINLDWMSHNLSQPGYDLNFTGSGQHVSVGNCGPIPATGTIEFWIKINVNQSCYPFTTCGMNYCTSGFSFYYNGSTLYAWVGNDGGSSGSYSMGTVPVNSWKHVAVSWNKNNNYIRLYMNGNLVNQYSTSYWATSFSNVMIGLGYYSSYYLRGEMDEVRIWNVERSQADIIKYRMQGLTGVEPGLIAYWNMNEGAGTLIHDISNHNHNGTFSGATWSASGLPFTSFTAVSPLSGSVAPGDSADITVKLSAGGLPNNNYQNTVAVVTNDPLHLINSIICTLELNGKPLPVLSDTLLDFPPVVQYSTGQRSLVLYNEGCDTLRIDSVRMAHSEFTIDGSLTQSPLPPYQSKQSVVTFSPVLPGLFTDTLRIYCRDTTVYLPVTATATGAPAMELSTDSVHAIINSCNDSTDLTVMVRNPGYDTLEWNAVVSATMGSALWFNGSGQYSTIGNMGAMPQEGAIEFWMNSSILQNYNNCFTTSGTGNSNVGIRFEENAAGVFGVVVGNNSGNFTGYTIVNPLPVNSWHHVAVSWNKTANKVWIYWDGNLISENNHTLWASNFQNVMIGVGYNTGRYWKGGLDEIRMWSVFRTGSQIRDFMNKRLKGYEPGLLAYWPMDEGSGNIIHDISGHNFNGSFSGAGWIVSGAPLKVFLSVLPASGFIIPGDSSILALRFKSTGFMNDNYENNLFITGNDPRNPSDTVLATLTVNGLAIPVPDPLFLDFDSTMTRDSLSHELTISNTGCDSLVVLGITTASADFTVEPTAFILRPGYNKSVEIEFSPQAAGEIFDTLTFYCARDTFGIPVHALGIPSPILYTGISEAWDTITTCSGTSSLPLLIRNEGESELAWSIELPTPQGKYALLFDTLFSRVEISPLGPPNNAWTLEAWVRPMQLPPGRKTIIGGANECADWTISMENGFFSTSIKPVSGCSQTYYSDVEAVIGQWYHVAAAYNGSQVRLYVDGRLKCTGVTANNYTGTSWIRLGSEVCCDGSSFPGIIDEVRIWTKTLTIDEIWNNLFTSLPASTPGLSRYYQMNEGSGGYTYSANGSEGILFDVYWLISDKPHQFISLNTLSGNLPPGDSITVNIQLDSRYLRVGDYSDVIHVYSNDPERESGIIPVHLSYRGTPDMDVNDFSMAYDTTIQFTAAKDSILIENHGCDTLILEWGNTQTGAFIPDDGQFKIPPERSAWYGITFLPEIPGWYEDTALIVNNDSTFSVSLLGYCVERPVIVVQDTVIEDSLLCEFIREKLVTVYNPGASPLIYQTAGGTPEWLMVPEFTDTVMPNDTGYFTIIFHRGDLPLGNVAASFTLYANDPITPELSINCLLYAPNILYPVSIGPDTGFCSGATVELKAGSGYLGYVWSTGTADSTIMVDQAGIYSVSVTDINNCQYSDTAEVIVYPDPWVECVSDTLACEGTSCVLSSNAGNLFMVQPGLARVGAGTGFSGENGANPFSAYYYDHRCQYLYTASDLLASGLRPGQIQKLGFIAGTGTCSALNQFSLKAGFNSLDVLSAFQNGLTTVYQPTEGYYLPHYGENLFAMNTPLNWDGTSSLVVEVCYDNAAWNYAPLFEYTTAAGKVFAGHCNNCQPGCSISTGYQYTHRPNLIVDGIIETGLFSWSGPSGFSSTEADPLIPSIQQQHAGLYRLGAINAYGCDGTDSIQLTVMPNPAAEAGPDQSMAGRDTIQLNASASGGNAPYQFLWIPGTGMSDSLSPTPLISVNQSMIYTLQVTDAMGCSGTDNVAVNVVPRYYIGGTVYYDNSWLSGLPDINVLLRDSAGNGIDTSNSNAQGDFAFPLQYQGTYHLSVDECQLVPGGINSIDALKVARHIVLLELLTGIRHSAADVNNDNVINSIDPLFILHRTVGNITSFPGGDWRFDEIQVPLNTDRLSEEIKGISAGDVNGSYVPLVKSSGNGVFVYTGHAVRNRDGTIDIPVISDKRFEAAAFNLEFSIHVPGIRVQEILFRGEGMVSRIMEGSVRMAWADVSGLHFIAGEPILTIRIRCEEDDPSITPITGIQALFADILAQEIPDVTLFLPEDLPGGSAGTASLGHVFPNPTTGRLMIPFRLERDGKVTMIIASIHGQALLPLMDEYVEKGARVMEADLSSLPEGLYFLRFAFSDKTSLVVYNQKIIINR